MYLILNKLILRVVLIVVVMLLKKNEDALDTQKWKRTKNKIDEKAGRQACLWEKH